MCEGLNDEVVVIVASLSSVWWREGQGQTAQSENNEMWPSQARNFAKASKREKVVFRRQSAASKVVAQGSKVCIHFFLWPLADVEPKLFFFLFVGELLLDGEPCASL